MKRSRSFFKPIVAATSLLVTISLPALAAEGDLPKLYDQLRNATPETAAGIEREIRHQWSKSGSPSIDILTQRGRDAIEAGDMTSAADHLTAAIDHAPDYATAYSLRALAYYNMELIGPAVADLERALSIDPDHFEALSGLAAVFLSLEDEARAAQIYQRVLAIHPNDETIRDSLNQLRHALEDKAL